MRRFATTVSALALIVSTTTAPAFAAIDPLGTNPVLDAQCNDFLSPSDNSDYTTYATGVSSSTVVGDPVGVGPTFIVPLGSPTTTTSGILPGSQHLNGGSPNIFGNVNITVSYADGAEVRQHTTITTTVTDAATGCHVHKPVGQNDDLHADHTAPPGLQDNVPAGTSTVTTAPGPDIVVSTIPGPYIDPTQSQVGVQVVICISPSTTTKKGAPGDWRKQNGYTGECSRALYDSLVGKFDPSAPPTNSLPST